MTKKNPEPKKSKSAVQSQKKSQTRAQEAPEKPDIRKIMENTQKEAEPGAMYAINTETGEVKKMHKGIIVLDRVFKFHGTVQIGKSAVPVEQMGHRGAVGFMLVYESEEQAKNAFPNESVTTI